MSKDPASASDSIRIRLIKPLQERGHDGLAELLTMLSDRSWSVRREVVRALGALGDIAAEPLCLLLRSQRDDEARIAACVDALSACVGESVDPALIALGTDPNPAVLADVAQILGRRRSIQGSALLIGLLDHPDDNVAVGAIEALGRIGGRAAVDALLRAVRSESFFRVFPAIDVLGRSGDPRAVEPLAALLRDSRYALEAGRALGRTADRRAVAPIASLLASPSLGNVRVAALSLLELSERHEQLYGKSAALRAALQDVLTEPATRRLVQSLRTADKAEKIAVCRVLGYSQSEVATPALLELLDADAEIAASAAQALMDSGRATQRAFFEALLHADTNRRKQLLPLVVQQQNTEAIVLCLGDPSTDVRVLACESLARVGAVKAVPALFSLLDDPNQRVVFAAVGAIDALGTAETEPLALAAALSEEPGKRRAALRILAYFGYPSALPLFVAAIADARDPRLRDIGLQGLALLEDPAATAHVLAAARSSESTTRAAAMRALSHASFGDEILVCLLEALADPDAWVRYYACQALGKLRIRTADGQIDKLLGDDAGHVRVAAVEALSLLGTELALSALRRLSRDPDLDLRRAALVGLGLTRDESSFAVLAQAASEDDPATQLVAISSLAALTAPEVVATLAAAAGSTNESVRGAAISLLAERPGRAAAEALVGLLLRDGEHAQIQLALAKPRAGLVEALSAAMQTVDDTRATLLAACLSHLQTDAARLALFETLTSPNLAARKVAVSAVAAIGSREAEAALQRVAQHDPDLEVRRIATLCLAS